MNVSSEKSAKKSKSCFALAVMRKLRSFEEIEMKNAVPLTVTYISNKKPKIIRCRKMSSESTDAESSTCIPTL